MYVPRICVRVPCARVSTRVAARECIIDSRVLHRSARIRTSAVTVRIHPSTIQRHTSRDPERAVLLIECNYDERRAQHAEKLTRYFLIIRFNSLRSCVSVEAPARSRPNWAWWRRLLEDRREIRRVPFIVLSRYSVSLYLKDKGKIVTYRVRF